MAVSGGGRTATIAAVAGAMAAVLALALDDTGPIGLLGMPAAAIAGVVAARALPRVAVFGPAVALAAAAVPGVLTGSVGRLGIGAAVGLGLAVPGFGPSLAPALPLAVVGVDLALGQPVDPVVLVLAALVGLAGGALLDERGLLGDGSDLRRRVLVAATIAVVLAPLALAVGPLVPRVDDVLPDPQPGDGDGDPTDSLDHPGFDGLDVGDPVELSDEVVMRVTSDVATFWRIATFADYDGRAWSEEAGTAADARVSPGAVELEEIRQAVTVVRPIGGGVPTAYRPVQVELGSGRARFLEDGTVQAGRLLDEGEIYTVRSLRPLVSDADLAGRRLPEVLPDDLDSLATEDDVTDRVAALAREVTAGEDDLLGAVRALEAEIERRVAYTRDIDPLPGGVEAVDHLLFESREGFCEQIGTALVVMARSLGIPARLVVGYVPTERDDLRGEWVVRADAAHAWAEVWFPEVGWVGFDPTAGVPLAADDDTGDIDPWPLLAVVGCLIAVGAVAVLGSRWWERRNARRSRTDDVVRSTALAERFERAATDAGAIATPTTTVLDLGRRAAARTGDPRWVDAAVALDDVLFAPPGPRRDDAAAVLATTLDELAGERSPTTASGSRRRRP